MTPDQHKIDLPDAVRKRQDTTKIIEIDMNPMVDLAFLLLTFFMLTTTFNQPQAMELVMPAKPKPNEEITEQPVKESRTITFVIGENDALFYYRGITDAQAINLEWGRAGLRQFLLKSNAEIYQMVVLIKPHPKSRYANLVDMLDEINITGIERYAIAEYSPFEDELLEKAK